MIPHPLLPRNVWATCGFCSWWKQPSSAILVSGTGFKARCLDTSHARTQEMLSTSAQQEKEIVLCQPKTTRRSGLIKSQGGEKKRVISGRLAEQSKSARKE